MDHLIEDPLFSYLTPDDKTFVTRFDDAMKASGFPDGGIVGPGYCWGRHLIAYAKGNAGSAKAVARVYLREHGIALRLYLSDIDRHRAYLERTSDPVLKPFLPGIGDCQHCHNERADGTCKFRKSYTLFDRRIDKCNGLTFEYENPVSTDIPAFLALLDEFRLTRRPLAR